MKNIPWHASIHHNGAAPYVSELYPKLGETVQLRLRVGLDAPVRGVYLRTFPDGEQALAPMRREPDDAAAQWWTAVLPIREPLVHYRFILIAAGGVCFYSAAGPSAHVPLDGTDFRIIADYDAPQWVHTAVFYQIFPDRFANGDPATDPQPGEYDYRGHGPQTYPWGAPPHPDQPPPLVFYGGDLPGVTQRLDYLQDLGVNALYLNPVFTAYSNHKYDVADYEQVDPHFGGNAALADLRRALDGRQMRYLLDIVPNHCGYWHPWFQAALENPDAPEADFFTFRQHPEAYESWLGVWTLPKLDYRSHELRRRIYDGETAVFRRWLREPYSADGWRVDVANMLGRQGETQIGAEITRGIRHAVKETQPDAYLMGENFFDATATLQGDQWDGVMNYAGFTHPLWYWLAGYTLGAHGLKERLVSPAPWPTAALAQAWQQHLAAIPWQIALQQFNLLDSHDTPRIRTTLGENDALHRLALAVQFTFPGVPCIYYGDEIGMVDDPALHSRGCMVWDEAAWDHDLLAFYRRLIALRRETAVLQTGGFQLLAVEPETVAFQRMGEGGRKNGRRNGRKNGRSYGRILTIAHRHAAPRPAGPLPVAHGGIPDGARFVEIFSGKELVVANGALPLPAHPQGATLWQQT